jgi:protein-arginine kinase activator protein McsA
MKICIKCQKEKTKDNFSKKNNTKDGLYYYCKQCVKENIKKKDWYINQYKINQVYKLKWEKETEKLKSELKVKKEREKIFADIHDNLGGKPMSLR